MLNDLCHFLPNNCHPGAHGEEPERAEERATVSNRNIALDRYIGVVYKRTPSNKPMTTPRRQGHRACRIAGSPGSTSAFPVGELPPGTTVMLADSTMSLVSTTTECYYRAKGHSHSAAETACLATQQCGDAIDRNSLVGHLS